MCRIFIAVTLVFLLLEPAASQIPQACQNAITGITTACVPQSAGVPADLCSGDCMAAYGRIFSQCSPQVSLYCCVYSYSEVAIIVIRVWKLSMLVDTIYT